MVNHIPYNNNQTIDRDNAFLLLTATFPDLKDQWNSYKQSEYQDYHTERLDYIDIGLIIDYIIDKKRINQTENFESFFTQVETILNKGDNYTQELIIIGLLEGIQNACGWSEIDYHKGFNEWLKPETKKAWDQIIYFWESEESAKTWEKVMKEKKKDRS